MVSINIHDGVNANCGVQAEDIIHGVLRRGYLDTVVSRGEQVDDGSGIPVKNPKR